MFINPAGHHYNDVQRRDQGHGQARLRVQPQPRAGRPAEAAAAGGGGGGGGEAERGGGGERRQAAGDGARGGRGHGRCRHGEDEAVTTSGSLTLTCALQIIGNLNMSGFVGKIYRLNPLVPVVQKYKSANLTFSCPLMVKFVKEMVYFNAHYSALWGFMV